MVKILVAIELPDQSGWGVEDGVLTVDEVCLKKNWEDDSFYDFEYIKVITDEQISDLRQ